MSEARRARSRGRPRVARTDPAPRRRKPAPRGVGRWIDRALSLAGGDERQAGTRLRFLRRVLFTWSFVRSVAWLSFASASGTELLATATPVLLVAAVLSFLPRFEWLSARIALPALLAELAATFPLTHNHFFIELYAVVILCFAGRDGRDDAVVLQGLRWLTAIVLFHTGLQKLLYGLYGTGDFLAFMVGRGDRFATAFRWVLPDAEVARLQSYDPFQAGAGPYRVAEPLFRALANGVWIAELVLPLGMLFRTTRVVAAGCALALVVAIQVGAREIGFALLFTNLLLLFLPAGVAVRLAPALLALLAWVAGAAAGVLPGREAIEAWHLW